MIATDLQSQADFYRGYLMAKRFDPKDFGIKMSRVDFIDLMIDEFNTAYRGYWTIDELCLHPREALRFCDDVRRKHGFYGAPDHIILRSVMKVRKNPAR